MSTSPKGPEQHLTEDNFRGIAEIMLQELKQSLAARELELTWSEDVKDVLVNKAYSALYGARNLRRTIQKELEDPISEKIIDSFEDPISKISVQIVDGEIQLKSE